MDVLMLEPSEVFVECQARNFKGTPEEQIQFLTARLEDENNNVHVAPNRPHQAAYLHPKKEAKFCLTALVGIREKLKDAINPHDRNALEKLYHKTLHIIGRLERMKYSGVVRQTVMKLIINSKQILKTIDKGLLHLVDQTEPVRPEDVPDIEITESPKVDEPDTLNDRTAKLSIDNNAPIQFNSSTFVESTSLASTTPVTANHNSAPQKNCSQTTFVNPSLPNTAANSTFVNPTPYNNMFYPSGSLAGQSFYPYLVPNYPFYNPFQQSMPVHQPTEYQHFPVNTNLAIPAEKNDKYISQNTVTVQVPNNNSQSIPTAHSSPVSQPVNAPNLSAGEARASTVSRKSETNPHRASFAGRNLNINLYFDGSRNGLSFDRFLFRVERLATHLGIPEDSLVDELHFFLKGQAAEFYWSTIEKHKGIISWSFMKNIMKDRYRDRRMDFDIRRSLDVRRQRRAEPFIEFYSAILDMALPLEVPLSDNDLLMLLIRNMSIDLQRKLAGEFFRSVETLVARCVSIEDDWSRIDKISPALRRVEEVEVVQHETEIPVETSVEAVLMTKKISPQDKFSPNSLDICWNCDDIGHRYRDCPAETRRIFCFGCGASNVVKPKCPTCLSKSGNSIREAKNPGSQRLLLTRPSPNYRRQTEEVASNTDPELYRRQSHH